MAEQPHVHDHAHTHETSGAHEHAAPAGQHHHHHHHDHSHDNDSYYIDQLCMVGLAGGYGVIALCLYFWQRPMLELLLGPQFFLFVLLSGIALVSLAVVRGVSLWFQAGSVPPHVHAHEHGKVNLDLVQGADASAHKHEAGECCNHEHGHEHHHHHHHHDHSHDDHDHGWAPWRYVVLLVPVILFMLGLPNKPPEAKADDVKVDYTQEALGDARLIAVAANPLELLCVAKALQQDTLEKEKLGAVQAVDFKELEEAAGKEERRELWENKTVEVRGQFATSPRNARAFSLVRYRIGCCAADAIQVSVPVLCREDLRGITHNSWVKVTGKVVFMQRDGAFKTVLLVPTRTKVELCTPDLNPYVQ
jgi:hypothetical protein